MPEQSETSSPTPVFPLTNTLGPDTMLPREMELLDTVVVVMGLGVVWGLVWVPMWPCSWVGVLQCTPQS